MSSKNRCSESEFRVLSPTAILGYGFPESSFAAGMARSPHLIAVDAGSTDPGPYYLGSGKSFTDRAFVKRDLGIMLRAAIPLKIPVVVGSAGGAGARAHLEWCREILLEVARESGLSFKLATIAADVPKETVLRALADKRVEALACVPPLTSEAVEGSVNIVAQFGVEPIQEALDAGADVVLAGRCYDPSVFAALPIAEGFDAGLALHMGKILECAAIAATPGSGADCAFGTLREKSFLLEALSSKRRFTAESAAAHTLYEKSDPYHLPGPGGSLNLTETRFRDLGDGRVEVSGTRFEPAPRNLLKLEGARLAGYRTISVAGVRDPIMIAGIDQVLEEVRGQILEMGAMDDSTERLGFRLYGKNGVMGELEPLRDCSPHELGIVIEAVAATQVRADTLCGVARSTLLHYGYEGRMATAGNLAFPFSPSDVSMGAVYEFSIYHLFEPDGDAVFPVNYETVTGGAISEGDL